MPAILAVSISQNLRLLMKVGDLVYEAATGRHGFVERVDVDHYGAGQAFKAIAQPLGHCIDSTLVLDVSSQLSPTKHGTQDRVLVCWTDGPPEYLESHELEVINIASR